MTTGRERWLHLYEFRVEGDAAACDWELLCGEERARAHSIADPVRRMRFVAPAQ